MNDDEQQDNHVFNIPDAWNVRLPWTTDADDTIPKVFSAVVELVLL